MTSSILDRTDISTHSEWLDAPIGSFSIDEYRELTGSQAEWPVGVEVALARLAFTRGKPMPPGGVLLGIDVKHGAGWPLGTGTKFRCATEERRDSRSRLVVIVGVDLREASHESTLTRVSFELRWPEVGEAHD